MTSTFQRRANQDAICTGSRSGAFGARTSDRAGRPWWERLVESRVAPQAGDRRDAAATHRVEEQQSRKAAVADQHEIAARQPATGLKSELASDVEQRLYRHRFARQARSDDTSAVRNGKAQMRSAQGMGASSIRLIQRSPLALTKRAPEERTGSR